MRLKLKSPLKEKPFHYPGQYDNETIIDLVFGENGIWLYFFYSVLMIGFTIDAWLDWANPHPQKPYFVSSITVVVILVSIIQIARKIVDVNRYKQGRNGEMVVGQHLEHLRPNGFEIYHDIRGQKFNIDHVALCEYGIFTIETKTDSKRMVKSNQIIAYDGKTLTKNGLKINNDVAQAQLEACTLQDELLFLTHLPIWIKPVLVYPGWYVECHNVKPEDDKPWVLNHPEQLAQLAKSCPKRYSPTDLILIRERLEELAKRDN